MAGSEACLAGSWARRMDGQTDGRTDGQKDGRTDGWTDGKSPHSTGLGPLSGPLPKKIEVEKGIGRMQQIYPEIETVECGWE